MNHGDERDLAEAFEELRAPRSTANYAARVSREVPTGGATRQGRQWRQALSAGLAVVVAVGAAGTFLALRSSRQAPSTAGAQGGPPPRVQSAMAYDSTSDVSVMYGGYTTSGSPLADTWVWDGTSWSAATQIGGPGPLTGARLVDDPADRGVLMIGTPALPSGSSGSGTACAGVGSTGSAVASPGAVVGSPVAAPGAGPATPTPTPGVAPATDPAAPTNASSPGAPVAPPSPCVASPAPSAPPMPGLQTWLFRTSSGWTRVADNRQDTPVDGAQLAFDFATQTVVAVASSGYPCGPLMMSPLSASATNSSSFYCPVMGAPGSSGGGSATSKAPDAIRSCAPNTPCPMPCRTTNTGACPQPGNTVSTWTWAGGRWTRQADVTTGALASPGLSVLVVEDRSTGTATLVGEEANVAASTPACAPAAVSPSCGGGTAPVITGSTLYWRWTGSTWSGHTGGPANGFSIGGATLVGAGGRVMAVAADGGVWTWTAGQWRRLAASSAGPGARFGPAIAAGPGKTVVLFGGSPNGGAAAMMNSLPAPGSDTWVYTEPAWLHAGGTIPTAAPLPSGPVMPPCPSNLKIACVVPEPATAAPGQVPPAPPASVPSP